MLPQTPRGQSGVVAFRMYIGSTSLAGIHVQNWATNGSSSGMCSFFCKHVLRGSATKRDVSKACAKIILHFLIVGQENRLLDDFVGPDEW